MAWRGLAVLVVPAIVAGHVPEPRGRPTGVPIARQRLTGPANGLATADVSADGHVVAFVSVSRLTTADDNSLDDVYVFDRVTERLHLESVTAGGRAADGSSQQPHVSGDGRFLVFSTVAPNIIGRGVESMAQVVRRDRTTGVTTLVSHAPDGSPGNGWSGHADISDDGRYVVFESRAVDLVAGADAKHGGSDIYLFDAADGSVRRVSLTDAGVQSASGQSSTPAISGTGRFVAFSSTAPIDGPARARPDNAVRSVFRRDLSSGATSRVSATRNGGVPNGPSYHPAITADGHQVAFVSTATNLDGVRGATREQHLYLVDAETGRVQLLSRSAAGGAADGASRYPAVSGDGRYVVFSSDASNLLCAGPCRERRVDGSADLNLVSDIYRVDTATGVVDRVSGGTANDPWWRASSGAAIDGTGDVVVFSSRQPIDEADLEDDDDLFIDVQRGPAGDRPGNGLRPTLVYR
jgi:Tol biopolymer transport system component